MYRTVALVAALGLVGCSAPPDDEAVVRETSEGAGLTAGDREALRALDQSYAKAWLKQDPEARSEAVLALFAPDAVIYPGEGVEPVSGLEELHRFWFAAEAPPVAILSYEREASAIEGSSALAAIAGHCTVTMMREDGRERREGHYIIHARPDAAGHWKIERMMWSDRSVG